MKSNQNNSRKIIQYEFLDGHPNALQQANSFNRIACMHNPNLKAFLSKFNELKGFTTPEQLRALEAIIKKEEDFIRPLAEKSGDADIREYMSNVFSTSEAFSLKIMQEAVLALKEDAKKIEKVQIDIINRLQESKNELINSTNVDLPRVGVLIEDKRNAKDTRIFIDKSVNRDNNTVIEDSATRLAKNIESLGLTPAQINYLKISVNQASFAGIMADIMLHYNNDIATPDAVTIKIVVEKKDEENKVFLELSRASLMKNTDDEILCAIFHKSRIDISSIEEEKITIGNQDFGFISTTPPMTTHLIAVNGAFNQELLAKQGIRDAQKSQKDSQKIAHEIANDCGIHVCLKLMQRDADSQKTSAVLEQELKKNSYINTISQALHFTDENLSRSFLENIMHYIKQLLDKIIQRDFSPVKPLSPGQAKAGDHITNILRSQQMSSRML